MYVGAGLGLPCKPAAWNTQPTTYTNNCWYLQVLSSLARPGTAMEMPQCLMYNMQLQQVLLHSMHNCCGAVALLPLCMQRNADMRAVPAADSCTITHDVGTAQSHTTWGQPHTTAPPPPLMYAISPRCIIVHTISVFSSYHGGTCDSTRLVKLLAKPLQGSSKGPTHLHLVKHVEQYLAPPKAW